MFVRLSGRIDTSGGGNSCWPWVGARNRFGYGTLGIGGGKTSLAHREVWRLIIGAIPPGMCVCHSCDNPACCRPSHLFLGTPLDNARDKELKGRGNQPKGERHGRAKLTVEQVREIRASADSQPKAAARYGVSHVLIGKIRRGELWASV
jgi:hypothetical protein